MTVLRRTLTLGAGATGVVLAAAFLLAGPGGAQETPGILPYTDPEAIALGADLYAVHCAACHGADLEGETPDWRSPKPDGKLPAPPHDETGHTWHHPDTQLFEITKYGTEAIVGGTYRSDMMGFGEILTDAEILAVLAYIKSTWSDRIIEMHNARNPPG